MCALTFGMKPVTRHAPAVVCYVRVFFGYIKRALLCHVKNCEKALGAFKQKGKKKKKMTAEKKKKTGPGRKS